MFLTNLIGRITLWSATGTLLFAGLAGISSTLWLQTPLAAHDWFLSLHRIFLGAFLGFGLLAFLTLFVCHRFLVPPRDTEYRPLDGARVHVGLTAYNDELSIGDAVRDFKACAAVHKVIVVENSSTDRTCQVALDAGAAEVITEKVPGYGSCCMRALAEAARGADVIVLCEGDMTFRGADVKKFLAYLENCDLVLGTRATQELRETGTQMDWLINPANQIMAKLVQTRFWGTRLTDVGCTYRAMRADTYHRLKDRLWVRGDHFSPHLFIEALKMRMRVIEIPVVFRKRVGRSKGVGSNKLKAARVALKMLGLLYRA
jgi:glycosyltransferase involved in cell wall biosynthesis